MHYYNGLFSGIELLRNKKTYPKSHAKGLIKYSCRNFSLRCYSLFDSTWNQENAPNSPRTSCIHMNKSTENFCHCMQTMKITLLKLWIVYLIKKTHFTQSKKNFMPRNEWLKKMLFLLCHLLLLISRSILIYGTVKTVLIKKKQDSVFKCEIFNRVQVNWKKKKK